MAEFAALIYENEAEWAKATPEWMGQVAKEHQQFAQENGAALRGGSQLQPTLTARSIRAGSISDGPMVTTLALSGYYLIDAPDIDAAVEIARRIPSKFGGIEVRPMFEGQG